MKTINIPQQNLRKLYLGDRLSTIKIAKLYGCDPSVIQNRLRKNKIKLRPAGLRRVKITKQELKDLYEQDKLTTHQIANKFDCCQATVWKRLHKYGIKPRSPHELYSNIPSKELLEQLYVKKKLSSWEIERQRGYSRSTIHRHLTKHGFVRSRAAAHVIYPRTDFNENLIEKAYIIGFSIGDLRVRKMYKNSETIGIACSSTVPEQIELIENLFKNYGRVWIKDHPRRPKCTHIEAYVNLSFSFLLDKTVPTWIPQKKEHFASFLAGFIDAEGSFFIAKGQAAFALGNYDADILFLIYEKLMELGIECSKPYEDHTKGYVDKEGYVRNNNYWQLRINRKLYLLKLFDLIEPYIQHARKTNDLKRAKENIIERNRKYGNINMMEVKQNV